MDILNQTENAPLIKESDFALPPVYENEGIFSSEKTRAVIKIQDGCNRFCSYCVIPYLRGRSRSRPLADIVSEAQKLSLKTKEIILTGIDTSSYGADIGLDLTALVTALGVVDCRKRLGSFECGIIDERLLIALKESGFCDHFHLSLQSGCDSVLKRMNRRYTAAEYLAKVELIRKHFPYAGITTDIITGFSSETEEEHRQTVDFVKAVGFSDIHVFPFSARKGTKAYSMPVVDEKIKAERAKELSQIKERLREDFLIKNIGQTAAVYVEQAEGDYNFGFTSNYIKVYTKAEPHSLSNHTMLKLHKDGIKGEIMEDCIFCKIRDGVIKSEKFYEDDKMFIIKDISPRAKLHYLMIPKKHYKLLSQMDKQDEADFGVCLKKVSELSESLGLKNGFRLIINQGEDAIQTVFHLHVHIMGGEKLPV